jgi:cell division protein ZapA (FtsZ GTPase activity inhibitor)
MSKKNVVSVTIQGAEYALRTETDPNHVRDVAAYVDQVINDVMESGAQSHKAVVLAALRIAGELFEARGQSSELASEMTRLSDEIRPWLPPAKRNS